MKNKKTFFLAIIVILAIVGGLIVFRMTSPESLTGKLNLPKNKKVSLQILVSKPTLDSALQSNYKSVLSKMSPEKKRLVKIQTYNASISTLNGFRSMLDLVEEAVNESSDSQSLRLQVLEQTQEADDKLSQLLSHYNNNFGNSPGNIADPIFEEDLLEPIIHDLIDLIVIPVEMIDIDLTQMMNDLQFLDDFLMSIGVLGADPSGGFIIFGYGTANVYNGNKEYVGSGMTQVDSNGKMSFSEYTCHHKSCGGDGKKYKKDKDGKWKKDEGFCADCGWGTLLNANPDDFVEGILLSNPINLNAWLAALQNLNMALDNFLGEISLESY